MVSSNHSDNSSKKKEKASRNKGNRKAAPSRTFSMETRETEKQLRHGRFQWRQGKQKKSSVTDVFNGLFLKTIHLKFCLSKMNSTSTGH